MDSDPNYDAYLKMRTDLAAYINEMCLQRGIDTKIAPIVDDDLDVMATIFDHTISDRRILVQAFDDDILRLDFFINEKDEFRDFDVLHIHTLAEEIHIPAIWVLFDLWFLRRS